MPFQRLRFIHQLGTTMWVYPSAVHSRFEHSLGTLHLASRILKKFKMLGIELEERDTEVFRAASLLHDIGHAPFSHVGEDMNLFEKGLNHERMGEKIIKETEIKDIISQNLGKNDIERIIFIITSNGRPYSFYDTIFQVILTGQAGIDRMDYLNRDSYFLGVMYGAFDIERIIETIRYDKERSIYWEEEGGVHALEQFILARYFMFTEVYFHKTRRILDYHLSDMIGEFLSEQGRTKFPSNSREYLELNDYTIITWMFSNKKSFKEIFLKRKFLKKIAYETKDHPSLEELGRWDCLEEKLSERFSKKGYYIDKAEKAPYKFEKEDIIVGNGEVKIPLEERSNIVKSLIPIKKRRIYAIPDKRDEITKFVKGFLYQK